MEGITPLHISQAYNLNIDQTDLDFFDANLFYDSLLFIDPFLLKRSPIEEEKELFKRFSHFFRLAYQKSLSVRDHEYEVQNLKLFLTFKEPKEINLGYTKASNKGSGPGGDFAESLLSFFLESSAARLVGAEDLFPEDNFNPKLVSVFADRFGEDGISDLTANLIMDYLIEYTQQQARNLNIPLRILPVQQSFDFDDNVWTGGINANLPENPLRRGEPVVFVPKRLLRSHFVSEKDEAIKKVLGILRHDPSLVTKFSDLITKPIKEIDIVDIRKILLEEDSVLRSYVNSFEEEQFEAYDLVRDPLEFLAIKRYEHTFDNLEVGEVLNCEQLFSETKKFIDLYRQENELRDGWKDCWTDDLTKPAIEEVSGRIFRAMGFSFFSKYPAVSFIPKTGAGSGLLDFAVIYGDCKIAIELKRLCNNSSTGEPPLPAYLHGIERQLPHYVLSLPAKNAIYLTLQHYRSNFRRGKNHDSRANEIRARINDVENRLKSQSTIFSTLTYINIDVSKKRPPSQI